MRVMNYGKAEEPNSSRSQYLSTARYAATSAILMATLSRSDRALPSPTVNAWAGWDADFSSCGYPVADAKPHFSQRTRETGHPANDKETTHMTTPIASNTPESNRLSVNVFTAPGKTMVGERPKPFGEALGFDPITS